MHYYIVNGNYVATHSVLPGAEAITEAQYNAMLAILRARPEIPEGYGARLTEGLTWELYPLPPGRDPADEDISDQEFCDILREVMG